MSREGLEALVELIRRPGIENRRERAERAFNAVLGAEGGRYRELAEHGVELRAPEMRDGKRFAAWVHKVGSFLGAYGGLCFVVFPIQGDPAPVGLVVGTDGPAPGEAVLGRPGHTRKAQAICA